MKFVSRRDIKKSDRLREINEDHAQALADDIYKNGLLQLPVIVSMDNPQLVIGGHRLRALAILEERGESQYMCNGTMTHITRLPVLVVGELSPRQLLDMELAENVLRLDLTWQERADATAKIHSAVAQLYTEVPYPNPDRPAPAIATAQVMQSGGDSRALSTIRQDVTRAVIMAEHMHKPEVRAAKTFNEAWTVVRKEMQGLTQRVMARVMSEEESIHTLHEGNFLDYEITDVDLILSDPPYGVDADSWTCKFKDTPHEYKDTLAHALKVSGDIFRLGLKHWTKPQASLFMFCSPEHWNKLAEMAILEGWTIWPRPLVWKKSNEGIRPWGIQGFVYTYESILYATKGEKGLLKSIPDVIEIYKVHHSGRLHGAQKPVELYQRLIEITCLPGDTILDPTCGSGTIFPACNVTQTIGIGCENNPELWPMIKSRFAEGRPEPTAQVDMGLDAL